MTLFPRPLQCAIFSLLLTFLLSIAAHSHAFTLVDTEGKTHRLEDYKGKWVIVNHWAPWCGPCLEELPDLAEFAQDRHHKDIVVLSVVHDFDTQEKIQKFARMARLTFPVVLGTGTAVKQFPTVKAIPTTFVYSPSGKLEKTHAGQLTQERFEEMMEELKK